MNCTPICPTLGGYFLWIGFHRVPRSSSPVKKSRNVGYVLIFFSLQRLATVPKPTSFFIIISITEEDGPWSTLEPFPFLYTNEPDYAFATETWHISNRWLSSMDFRVTTLECLYAQLLVLTLTTLLRVSIVVAPIYPSDATPHCVILYWHDFSTTIFMKCQIKKNMILFPFSNSYRKFTPICCDVLTRIGKCFFFTKKLLFDSPWLPIEHWIYSSILANWRQNGFSDETAETDSFYLNLLDK